MALHSPGGCFYAAWTDWAVEGAGQEESLNHLGLPLHACMSAMCKCDVVFKGLSHVFILWKITILIGKV